MKEVLEEFHKNLSEEEKKKLAQNLCEKITALSEYKAASLILAYIPDRLEADCRPVIYDALKKGKKVAIPKVDFKSLKEGLSKMDFYLLDGKKSLEEQLERGAYGIREPKSELKKLCRGVAGQEGSKFCPAEGVATNEVGAKGESYPFTETRLTSPFMIVPGVAFTKDGKRLGHGKGFYDIYISEMKRLGEEPFLCGVCLPCQLLEEIPTDEHDVRMDSVLC